jgi:hypothetical protein
MASLFILLILPYSGMRIFPQKGYRTSFFIPMQKFVNNLFLCNEHIVIAYNLAFVMIYNSRVFIFLQAIHQFLNAVLFYKSGKSLISVYSAALWHGILRTPASGNLFCLQQLAFCTILSLYNLRPHPAHSVFSPHTQQASPQYPTPFSGRIITCLSVELIQLI